MCRKHPIPTTRSEHSSNAICEVVYRYAIPEDDVDVSLQAYQWPKKMVEIMKESTSKVTAEQREFEQELKNRRKNFGHLLEDHEKDVLSLQDRSEIHKKDQMMLQVKG